MMITMAATKTYEVTESYYAQVSVIIQERARGHTAVLIASFCGVLHIEITPVMELNKVSMISGVASAPNYFASCSLKMPV